MIVFLGVVVGGVVISMYLPLFSLIGKLSSITDRAAVRLASSIFRKAGNNPRLPQFPAWTLGCPNAGMKARASNG